VGVAARSEPPARDRGQRDDQRENRRDDQGPAVLARLTWWAGRLCRRHDRRPATDDCLGQVIRARQHTGLLGDLRRQRGRQGRHAAVQAEPVAHIHERLVQLAGVGWPLLWVA